MAVRRIQRASVCLCFVVAQVTSTAQAADPIVAAPVQDAEKAPAAVDPRRSAPRDHARELAQRQNARRLQAHLRFDLHAEWAKYLKRGRGRTFFGYLEHRYRRRPLVGGILLGLAVPTMIYGSVEITGAGDPGIVVLGALCVGGGVVVSAVGLGLTIPGALRLRRLRAAGELLQISGVQVRLRGVGPIVHPSTGMTGIGAGIEF